MIIDLLIVAVVLGTAWAGFQRGLVQPLLAELFALLTLMAILHNRAAFAGLAEVLFHATGFLAVLVAVVLCGLMGYFGARLGGMIRRMPVVTGADGFVGVWIQALFGVAMCYLVISGIVVMDRAFNPVTTTSVNAKQLAAMETELGTNAFTSGAIDEHDLAPYDARAARPGGVTMSELPGISTLQGLQRDVLQPQLAGSRLARYVVNVGRHIPGMGHVSTQDLPRRTASGVVG